MHCNDGTSFSYVLSSAYQPQTVSHPAGITSIDGLVGAAIDPPRCTLQTSQKPICAGFV